MFNENSFLYSHSQKETSNCLGWEQTNGRTACQTNSGILEMMFNGNSFLYSHSQKVKSNCLGWEQTNGRTACQTNSGVLEMMFNGNSFLYSHSQKEKSNCLGWEQTNETTACQTNSGILCWNVSNKWRNHQCQPTRSATALSRFSQVQIYVEVSSQLR